VRPSQGAKSTLVDDLSHLVESARRSREGELFWLRQLLDEGSWEAREVARIQEGRTEFGSISKIQSVPSNLSLPTVEY
jgi:hypothetical protein